MPAVEGLDGIVVLADADCWTDGLARAVRVVESGAATWSVPHTTVRRLTQEATDAVLNGAELAGQSLAQRPYPGVVGGGFVVASGEVIRSTPLDPRFVGWG